jgi:NAD-dependent deacetylase
MDTGQLERAVALLRGAQRVLVLTGAGVSKESGIPTYRDALTGLWAKYDFAQLASPEGFRADPATVWAWYAERRAQLRGVQPNAGHVALARLAAHVPHLTLVTQNVDDLHERAGSRDVLHLHGLLTETRCFFNCQGEPTRVEDAAFAADTHLPPRCPHCGRWLRPAVVWFGEMLPAGAFERAHDAAVACDVCLVIGTSGMVYPAAQLPVTAKLTKARVIEINPDPDAHPSMVDVVLAGKFGEVMPALLARLTGEG